MTLESLSWRRVLALAIVIITTLSAAACESRRGILDPRLDAPVDLFATYSWDLQRWDGNVPVGTPSVELTWGLPSGWQGDPFRVYSRRGSGSYSLVATVTSCVEGVCQYIDTNVRNGERYDYFVATVDERTGQEADSHAIQINVPAYTTPATPQDVHVTGLDNMNFVQWTQTGAQRFTILLQSNGSYFDLGETDGQSFLDDRAQNGIEHRYFVAAIDEAGHYSRLSAGGIGIPRPDYHAELLWTHQQAPGSSGFQFVADPQGQDPVVSGTSSSAQWRVENSNGSLVIRPLGNTLVSEGTFTSALSCGPGADPDCLDINNANQAGALSATPVLAESGSTYVFRVQANDGRTHFAKIRVLGATRDGDGNEVLVFDWAYQLIPGEVMLNVGV